MNENDINDLTECIRLFLDTRDIPYNFMYLNDIANKIADDLDAGIAQDPYYKN
jgi:hypothetical protein